MKWILHWLMGKGVAVEGFKEILAELGDKLDVPTEWQDRVGLWLTENTSLSSEEILAFVALAYLELKGGAPGYNKDAGGVA